MSLSAELDDSDRSRARNRATETWIPHPSWDAALVRAAEGARTRGLTAVVGEPGTGKSLLLARLHAALETAGISAALVRDPRSDQLAAADVLLLDDADGLSPEELRTLCGHAPSCVVAGRPELARRLAEMQAEAATIALPPLSARETGGFFRALVRRDVGAGADVDDGAVAAMVEHSAGVPRAVATLAGLAAFAAGLEDAEHILARHVEAAARLRSGGEEEAPDAGRVRSEPPPFSIFDRPAEAAASGPAPVASPERRRAQAAVACSIAAASAFALVHMWTGFDSPPAAHSAPGPVASAAEPPASHVAEWRAAPADQPREPSAPAPVEPPASPATAERLAAQAEPPPPPPPSPPATIARPAAALPMLAAYHVVVTYPGHDKAAERRGRSFAALLASHGVVVDPPRSRPDPAQSGVLFYFAEDAAPAEVVANDLDSTARPARRGAARSAREQPLPGTIEVALPLRP